ncbi:MAG: hypothetical protein KIS87_13465 [Phycisphaeraceae bacterium]|nr:hypothetical protein [Phycisphaeraceae bacterium]
MRRPTRKQIVLFATAAASVACAVIAVSHGDRLELRTSVFMVDVSTGELFRFPITGSRGVGVPNFNPETNALSLLPVRRDEGGQWRVVTRALSFLDDLEVEACAVQDRSTGLVRVRSDRARTVRVR